MWNFEIISQNIVVYLIHNFEKYCTHTNVEY